MSRYNTVLQNKRICYSCGTNASIETITGYQKWYHNHDKEDNVLCRICYYKFITNPKWNPIWNPINRNRKIRFKGKLITFKFKPRTGVCSWCKRDIRTGEIKKTALHHTHYDRNNPLANTVELCVSCHMKETYRIKKANKSKS